MRNILNESDLSFVSGGVGDAANGSDSQVIRMKVDSKDTEESIKTFLKEHVSLFEGGKNSGVLDRLAQEVYKKVPPFTGFWNKTVNSKSLSVTVTRDIVSKVVSYKVGL